MSLEDRYMILLQNEQRKAGAYFDLYLGLLEQLRSLICQVGRLNLESRSVDTLYYVAEKLAQLEHEASDKLENLDLRQIEVQQ